MSNLTKHLSEVSKESEDEVLDFMKRHCLTIAHNMSYVIGVWYYEIGSGNFEISKEKIGHLDDNSLELKNNDDIRKKLLRGRVIQYKGITFCVIYLDPDMSFVTRISKSAIFDLKYKIQNKLGIVIDYVLNDSGETMLSEKKIQEEMNSSFKEIR